MRLAPRLLALALVAALAGCAVDIPDINARPSKYYEHKVTFTGRIARTQVLADSTLLEVADSRGHRILVRSTAPVEQSTGDWVKVTGVLVPEARAGDTTLYDVVVAERIVRTRAPRFANLM